MTDFLSLGISPRLNSRLGEMNINTPTAVQQEAIPAVLEGRNIVVQSPTGTGKTLAYLAPLMTRLESGEKELEAIVLAPSRELSVQVLKVIQDIGGDISSVSLIGGANIIRQIEVLKKNKPQIAVGTPGRILDLIRRRKINGQAVKSIIVDEADKMFSLGFMTDVQAILKATLKTRQVAFFSATIPEELLKGVPGIQDETLFINLSGEGKMPPALKHLYFTCKKLHKTPLLIELLSIYKPSRAMVFIQTNEGVGPLAGRLQEQGISALALHSDLSQALRKEILNKFRQGKGDVLVTTDLLARGMDISDVDYVFNYDLPKDEKHYLHRAGRTGRAGREGTVITLVPEEQKYLIPKLARALRVHFVLMGLGEGRIFAVKYGKDRYKKDE